MKRRVLISVISSMLAVVLLFLTVSCGKPTIKITEENLLAAYSPRQEAIGVIASDFRSAMADFSFSLLKNTLNNPERSENKLLSPLSAVLCLALIVNGAEGETRRQMSDVLGMEPSALNAALRAYTQSLSSTDDAKMELANSVWFRDADELTVLESFLQTVADWYDAQAYAAAFDEKTVDNINKWCEKYTDGMIKKIIDRIDADDMLYLINALVFDAKWEKTYESNQIIDGKFTETDGTMQDAIFLSSEESVYLSGEGFFGVVKDYMGGAYSFVGLLPEDEKADIAAFAASLTGKTWLSAWESRNSEKVLTRIPEFRCEDRTDLTEILRSMGMNAPFDSSQADFSSMATCQGGNLYLAGVYQKTYLELDRHGTKAAAVTWGNMKKESAGYVPAKTVYLDRPFVYLIVDNETGLPLFVGITEKL